VAKKTAKKNVKPGSRPKRKGVKGLSDAPVGSGANFQEQDPKRRLGNYATTGEHARQGGRTSGIVGQTKQKNKTDKKKK
jgi:hypothetical protein